MSIGTLKQPILSGVGGCIPLAYFKGVCPCPMRLQVFTGTWSSNLVVNFNGRGYVGTDQSGSACSTDPYVSVVSTRIIDIDIWKAYRDGIWTSSVVINGWTAEPGATTNVMVAYPNYLSITTGYPSVSFSKTGVNPPTSYCLGGGGAAQRTITVTDAGVITLT